MKKFFHSISTMMLLVALTGMGLASCSESPEAPEDPTENPDDEDKGDGSEGEGGDENKTVELNYTVAEAAYWGDDYMEDGTSNLIVYLYDSPRDEDGVHTGPKDHFNIDMNLPNFNGGELLIPARSYRSANPKYMRPIRSNPASPTNSRSEVSSTATTTVSSTRSSTPSRTKPMKWSAKAR